MLALFKRAGTIYSARITCAPLEGMCRALLAHKSTAVESHHGAYFHQLMLGLGSWDCMRKVGHMAVQKHVDLNMLILLHQDQSLLIALHEQLELVTLAQRLG